MTGYKKNYLNIDDVDLTKRERDALRFYCYLAGGANVKIALDRANEHLPLMADLKTARDKLLEAVAKNSEVVSEKPKKKLP